MIGRTGAGKSSLISAMFRTGKLMGTIRIDGIATSDLSLKTLRSNMSVIPQVRRSKGQLYFIIFVSLLLLSRMMIVIDNYCWLIIINDYQLKADYCNGFSHSLPVYSRIRYSLVALCE